MTYKELTREDLINAETYMPIMDKQEFVSYAAERCFDSLSISAQYGGDSNKTMPSMYKENSFKKARYLAGAFLKFYFKFDVDCVGDDPWLITADEYDRYMGGHIIDQIQRMKSDCETRNKAFDILTDYKELAGRLDKEIYGLLKAMNDPVARASMLLTQAITPEDMKNLFSELEKSKNDLEEYIAQRGKEEGVTADNG